MDDLKITLEFSDRLDSPEFQAAQERVNQAMRKVLGSLPASSALARALEPITERLRRRERKHFAKHFRLIEPPPASSTSSFRRFRDLEPTGYGPIVVDEPDTDASPYTVVAITSEQLRKMGGR